MNDDVTTECINFAARKARTRVTATGNDVSTAWHALRGGPKSNSRNMNKSYQAPMSLSLTNTNS